MADPIRDPLTEGIQDPYISNAVSLKQQQQTITPGVASYEATTKGGFDPIQTETYKAPLQKEVGASPVTNQDAIYGKLGMGGFAENRLDRMLSEDSKYLTRAQSLAQQQGNARGLLNSSMTAGAGTAAAIDAAAPFALQDAQTYAQNKWNNRTFRNEAEAANARAANEAALQKQQLDASRFAANQEAKMTARGTNTAAANEAAARAQQLSASQRLANQDAVNAARSENAAAQNAAYQTQAQIAADQYKMYADTVYRDELMRLDESIKGRLSGLEQDYAMQLESLKQNFSVMENLDTVMGTMYGDSMKSLATFLENDKLSAEEKTQGVDLIVGSLESGLQFLSGLEASAVNVTPQVESAALGGAASATTPTATTPATPVDNTSANDWFLANMGGG